MSLFFSALDYKVVLNKHVCKGFSDSEDAIMLPDLELATVVRGADGLMVASQTGNTGGQVALKFMPNSPSTKFFMQQAARVIRGEAVLWEGSIENTRAKVSTSLQRGVMVTAPAGQTVGKGGAGEREFVFDFEVVLPHYDDADFQDPAILAL